MKDPLRKNYDRYVNELTKYAETMGISLEEADERVLAMLNDATGKTRSQPLNAIPTNASDELLSIACDVSDVSEFLAKDIEEYRGDLKQLLGSAELTFGQKGNIRGALRMMRQAVGLLYDSSVVLEAAIDE